VRRDLIPALKINHVGGAGFINRSGCFAPARNRSEIFRTCSPPYSHYSDYALLAVRVIGRVLLKWIFSKTGRRVLLATGSLYGHSEDSCE
jgi:hypothetical protein